MSYDNAVAAVYARDSKNVLRMLMIVEKPLRGTNDNLLNMPGGKRDTQDNDNYTVTAKREMMEETMDGNMETIDQKSMKYMWSYSMTHRNNTVSVIVQFFYDKIVDPAYKPLKNSETVGMVWVRVDQFRCLRDKKLINDTDHYEVVKHKLRLRGCCVNTFKSLSGVLDADLEQRVNC